VYFAFRKYRKTPEEKRWVYKMPTDKIFGDTISTLEKSLNLRSLQHPEFS